MIEVEVGVEIRRYATVRVLVEESDNAYQQAEKMVLDDDNKVSWNEPVIGHSEILSEVPLDPVEILADTLYEEIRELRYA